ncbi:type II toxin-antitoxin system RelE/ParE family toxin [Moraxella lacunata]|nr:type II toxin-antitoxin system RelE/ParE family toxin [Moraxella lacunata]
MYTVLMTEHFTEWLTNLSQSEQESMAYAIKLLQTYGHELSRPYADTLYNSTISNLKELRIQHSGKPYRAFFAFDPRRQAILLCAGDKTGDKRFYQRMIPLAESLYQAYLEQL